MFVGFTNVITNFNARDARDAASKCPLDRMLIETDAPHFVPRTLRSDTFGGTTPVSMSHPGNYLKYLFNTKLLWSLSIRTPSINNLGKIWPKTTQFGRKIQRVHFRIFLKNTFFFEKYC